MTINIIYFLDKVSTAVLGSIIALVVTTFLCVLSLCCLVKKCKNRARNGEIYEVVGEGYNDRGQRNHNRASHQL